MHSDLALLVLVLGGVDPDGLDFVQDNAGLPFLARMRRRAAWGAWEAGDGDMPALPALLDESLSINDIRPALINLPWTGPAPDRAVFFIGREPGPLGAPVVSPAELADDLADYLPDPPRPKLTSHRGSARGKADVAFAEQAAVTRIRFEHTGRLAMKFTPGLLAVNLGGLRLTRALFGSNAGRWLLLLRQLDSYFKGLADALNPAGIALVGTGGLLAVSGPAIEPGAGLGRLSIAGAGALLAGVAGGGR